MASKNPAPITQEDLEWAQRESILRLEERRKKLKLSINAVARRTGLDVSNVWAIFKSTEVLVPKEGKTPWRMRAITRDTLEIALGFDIGESVPRVEEIRRRQRIG